VRVAERVKAGCGCGGARACRCNERARDGAVHDFAKIAVASDEERSKMTAAAKGNVIDLTFDPATTKPVPKCTRIVTVQTVKDFADGKTIMPGTYYAPWKFKDKVALADSTAIDHVASDKTPYYTDTGVGSEGHSNGGTKSATEKDTPNTGGGDKGFYSKTNASGWKTVKYEYETFGYCAEGTDCGQFYEGIAWTYTKTDADATAGKDGTVAVGSDLAKPGAAAPVVKAFDKFNTDRGFVPCPKKAP